MEIIYILQFKPHKYYQQFPDLNGHSIKFFGPDFHNRKSLSNVLIWMSISSSLVSVKMT